MESNPNPEKQPLERKPKRGVGATNKPLQSSILSHPELWNASEMVHDPVHAKLACLSPETNSDCGLKDLARA